MQRALTPPLVLIVLAIGLIVFGFSHTFSRVVLSPDKPPPLILYVHVVLAAVWLVCLVIQAALAAAGQRSLHQFLGPGFAAVGVTMSCAAFFTAIDLRRIEVADEVGRAGDPEGSLSYLAIPLAAWIMFTLPFALALVLRRRPARHRSLMLVATCGMMGPALGRIPELRHAGLYWAGVIPVVLMGAATVQERLRSGTFNLVYSVGIPSSLAILATAVFLENARLPFWIAASRWMLATF